jgi:hypothetical protein
MNSPETNGHAAHEPHPEGGDDAGQESLHPAKQHDPGVSTVYDYLLYGLSLPERALRSTGALVGGTLRKSSELLLPRAFRNSQSYRLFLQQMLDFVVEDVGGVQRDQDAPPSAAGVDNFVAKKAVANFIDLASLATVYMSPLLMLALLSDVAYGSQSYLKEFSKELKEQGVIDQHSTIDNAADLLSAVRDASAVGSEAFSVPPLTLKELKKTIEQTQSAIKSMSPSQLIPQAEAKRLWNDIHATAQREQVGVLHVSGAMTMYVLNRAGKVGRGALSTVKVTGSLLDQHIFDYYLDGLKDIRAKGLYASITESSKPYIEAVWRNFANSKRTITQDVFSGRLLLRIWRALRNRMSRRKRRSGSNENETGSKTDPSSP